MFIIVILFLEGMRFGKDTTSTNKLFEIEKEKFEENIQKYDNDYLPQSYKIKDTIVNKVAKKIDKTIKKLTNKFN